jgi:hypothetical protein
MIKHIVVNLKKLEKMNKYKIMQEIEKLSKEEKKELSEWLSKLTRDERWKDIEDDLHKIGLC